MANLKPNLKNKFNVGALVLCALFCFSFCDLPKPLQRNQKANFVVFGNCTMCKERIESTVLNLPGMKYASWNMELKTLSIIFNQRKTNLREVQKAIAGAGHDTPLVKAEDSVYQALPLCCLYPRVDITAHQTQQRQ
ncbi:MAG: heavy metal-associated domain-containing protein [Flavobacteriaceae bacterium]|nr:heavy metal-associated domain-containing protein [Flavobacteriaceae bacterium]MCY4253581.1 heavy metal-associated domain-containing protein [Flavobacteriaceae bacterium]